MTRAPVRREVLEDLDQFREEVRAWLEANCPQSQRQPMTREEQFWGGRRGKFPTEDARLWYERMRDRGWIVPEWPSEYGGGGLSERHARIIKDEMKRINARTPLYGTRAVLPCQRFTPVYVQKSRSSIR